MHEVLVNRLGGLSLPRKSVVRLTDRPDMTLDVYRGRKTTIQQQQGWHHAGGQAVRVGFMLEGEFCPAPEFHLLHQTFDYYLIHWLDMSEILLKGL